MARTWEDFRRSGSTLMASKAPHPVRPPRINLYRVSTGPPPITARMARPWAGEPRRQCEIRLRTSDSSIRADTFVPIVPASAALYSNLQGVHIASNFRCGCLRFEDCEPDHA